MAEQVTGVQQLVVVLPSGSIVTSSDRSRFARENPDTCAIIHVRVPMHVRPQNVGQNKSKLVPAKKPTKFMTNLRALGIALSKKCDCSHERRSLVDGRAAHAARYPDGLCRAICRRFVKEKIGKATGYSSGG